MATLSTARRVCPLCGAPKLSPRSHQTLFDCHTCFGWVSMRELDEAPAGADWVCCQLCLCLTADFLGHEDACVGAENRTVTPEYFPQRLKKHLAWAAGRREASGA